MSTKKYNNGFIYQKKFTAAGFDKKANKQEKQKLKLYTENWDVIRKNVYRRDGNRCVLCGSKGKLHCHHIIPVRISKDNSMSNLISACEKCHRKLEEVGFAILQHGGGTAQIRRAELEIITEARTNRLNKYVKKAEERKNGKSKANGDADKSAPEGDKNAKASPGNNGSNGRRHEDVS